jgi:hypothetical protein
MATKGLQGLKLLKKWELSQLAFRSASPRGRLVPDEGIEPPTFGLQISA